jgi:hypothetical protein
MGGVLVEAGLPSLHLLFQFGDPLLEVPYQQEDRRLQLGRGRSP